MDELDDKALEAMEKEAETNFARFLRKHPTPAEKALWQVLKGSRLDGLKFRRQVRRGGYFLDLYCPSLKLAIEVDGSVHDGRSEEDAQRDANLAGLGILVIRFRNSEVFDHVERVLEEIKRVAAARQRYRY